MNEEKFAQILDEIMSKIEDGPGSHSEAFRKIAERNEALKELQKVASDLEESMGAIRLIIKYLVFDLEVTRRERDAFRMKLEDMDS